MQKAPNQNKPAIDNSEKGIIEKIAEIAAIANQIPGVIIIHNICTLTIEYMSPPGLKQLGITLNDLKKFSSKEYHDTYFNPEDAADYVPKIMGLLERNNNDEVISFFQQVRASKNHEWVWYMSTIKILMRKPDGQPLLSITISCPIDPEHHFSNKVSRLLEENNFLRKNYSKFLQLSKREREVLKLLALGQSSKEIAETLFISFNTAETHRRNLRKKLDISSTFELSQYARAFDLI